MTLRSGEAPSHVPNHLDCLAGACRPAGRIDGGPVDRVLNCRGGGFRALGVYSSRRSVGRVGTQHLGFDDLEEEIGLSRTYRVEIAESGKGQEVVDALRDLPGVREEYAAAYRTFHDDYLDLDDGQAGSRLVDAVFVPRGDA